MKKLVTIFVLCLACMRGQISIVNITPENICGGDSVDVCFTIDRIILPSETFSAEIYFSSDVTPPTSYHIFSGPVSWLGYTDTLIAGKRVYYRRIQIPYSFASGQWCAAPNMAPTMVYCIWVNDCYTDANEREPNTAEATYTTLFGTPTSRVTNTILIEQRGTNRRKVVFQE